MSGATLTGERDGPRLEEAVLAALEAVSARRPSRLPRCPVCAGAMRPWAQPGDRSGLRCLECESVLAHAGLACQDSTQLRLVS